MGPVAEAVFVWFPTIGAAAFVVWFALRCYLEGVPPMQILIDRRFLMVVVYTGALWAIYLSSVWFFSMGVRRFVPEEPNVTTSRGPVDERPV